MPDILIPEGAIGANWVYPEPPNIPPTANAGPNQNLPATATETTLSGIASDNDGNIVMIQWEKISGDGIIETEDSLTTKVTGLKPGNNSVFRLYATDDKGAVVHDDISIMVANIETPPPPTPSGYEITYRNGFDKLSDLTDKNGQYGNGTVKDFDGRKCFYSVPAQVSGGMRSEWQSSSSIQNPPDGFIEYDVFYEIVVGSNGRSLQWHPSTSGGGGSPRLEHADGKFLWLNWINGGNQSHPTGIIIPKAKWLKIRVEYKFGRSGYLRWYIDGKEQPGGWTGQVGDNSGFYLKLGWNSWGSDGKNSRIYYDNLIIGKKIA